MTTRSRTASPARRPARRSPRLVIAAIATLAALAAGCITPSDPRLDDESRVDGSRQAAIGSVR